MNDDELLATETIKDTYRTAYSWGPFSGGEIVVFFAGVVLALCIWFTQYLGMPMSAIIFLMVVSIGGPCAFIALFMYKKPPHTFDDTIDGITHGNEYRPYDKIYSHMPEGIIHDHTIIWDGMQSGSWSCGIELDIPALNYAKNRQKNYYIDQVRAIINYIGKANYRIQIYWSVDSNYSAELYQYQKETEQLPDGASKEYRRTRYAEYKKMSDQRILRRERVVVFLSAEIPEDQKISYNTGLKEFDERSAALLENFENQAEQAYYMLRNSFSVVGIATKLLDAQELITLLRKHMSPMISLAPVLYNIKYDPAYTVREQVVFSDMSAGPGGGFVLDGMLYRVYALRRPLPQEVYYGMIHRLTQLVVQDYEIVVNIIPLDTQKIVHEESKNLKTLFNKQNQPNANILDALEYRDRAALIDEMHSGHYAMLNVQYFVIVHGIDVADISAKVSLIKGELSKIGVGYYELTSPMAAINAFFQGLPGWLYGDRKRHKIRTLDKYIAPLLPLTSTYTGQLDGAEAIYLGEVSNLIGMKQFAKPILSDSDPQHALLFGKTGSGKSVLTADLIMQTHGFYTYTCIIDYGLSYQALAEQLGTAPIRLGPSSAVSINYFDTSGLPLTGDHMSMVSAILRAMSDGIATDGMIMRYLQPFYLSTADRWLHNHPELKSQFRTIAYLQDQYLRERICENDIEAYQKACAEWKEASVSAETLTTFEMSDNHLILFQVFAHMRPDEFPTHSAFVRFLRGKPLGSSEEDYRTLQLVTDALELWRHDGKNGRLFDGITNLEMRDDFQYFELSAIPSNDLNYKFAAGVLIQILAMQKIERMDRKLKKRLIIDEANSLFEIPQGVKIVENALTKFRKHRCSVLISFQQYEMLDKAGVKESITGNIQQYILMGQSDRNDVDRLGHALGLSGVIGDAVLQFETPANQVGQKYSSFAQVVKTKGMLSGIGRNVMSAKLLEMIGCK